MCNMQILSDSNQGIMKSAFCKFSYNERGEGMGFRILQVYLSIYKWSPFTLFQTPDGILLLLNWPSQLQQTQKRGIQHFQGYLYFPGVFIKLQKSIISQGLKSHPSFLQVFQNTVVNLQFLDFVNISYVPFVGWKLGHHFILVICVPPLYPVSLYNAAISWKNINTMFMVWTLVNSDSEKRDH